MNFLTAIQSGLKLYHLPKCFAKVSTLKLLEIKSIYGLKEIPETLAALHELGTLRITNNPDLSLVCRQIPNR